MWTGHTESILEIRLNDQTLELIAGTSVSDILRAQDLWAETGFAVAVNDVVVPRSDWESYLLSDRDSILVIQAFGGG